MKMVHLAKEGLLSFIDTDTSLESLYKLIGCSCITMFNLDTSEDEKRDYDIYLDDEGMLVDNFEETVNFFSIIPYQKGIFNQLLYGNMLLTASNPETGEFVDIDRDEAMAILKKFKMIP